VDTPSPGRRGACLSLLCVVAGCAAPDLRMTAPAETDATRRALAAIVADPAMPLASLVVAAVRAGQVVYQGQFGRRYIDASDPARDLSPDRDTLFRIASISKLVTTIAVMRLVEQGVLALDRDLSPTLGWPLRNPHFPDAAITLRQLLTHTSSLRDDAGYYWPYREPLREVLLPAGARYGTGAAWSRQRPPGDYFSYANLPWGVVATAMECATGERFDRLLQRLVFAPLGLGGGFHPPDFTAAEIGNTATLYRKRREEGEREIWAPDGPWIAQVDDFRREAPVPRAGPDYRIGSNGTAFGPQGACRLSLAGLTKVMRLLIGEGSVDGVRLLAPATVRQMLARQWQHDATRDNGRTAFGNATSLFNAWGLGNQHFIDLTGPQTGDRLLRRGGFTAVGHLGDAWGLTSALVFDPATGDGAIFMTGGPGRDPAPTRGEYSALYRHEERILDALLTLARSR